MDEETLSELREIDEIEDFIDFISPYYPDLDIEDYTIEKIEKELQTIYVKIIGRILSYSPKNMRRFLKAYLLQYEITNIKQIILGTILGFSRKQKSEMINFLAEEYLENVEFIRGLLDLTSLDQIRLYMEGTKYYEAIREGLVYFKNTNEIFVLESFLDQLFYKNLKVGESYYNRKEKEMINFFVNSRTEIYNLNLIYRGIINNIDRNLLEQFLVKNYVFLSEKVLRDLVYKQDIDSFISYIASLFGKIEEIKKYYHQTGIREEHFYWWIEGLYIDYFFTTYKFKEDDIDYSTILQIFEVLIKKEKEVRFDILPNVVKIIHEKFDRLEKKIK
jgi:vacuolar-type H+-ATPase subunit C/Vma6